MSQSSSSKNTVMMLIGTALLIVGITLILVWWPEMIALLKGAIGFVLALAGLVVLYSIKK